MNYADDTNDGNNNILLRRSRDLPLLFLAVAISTTISTMAGCSGTPERHAYDIADRRAEWLDAFSADRRACAAAGGVIVQERHQPDPIRVGGPGPEVGTRYHCRR